MDWQLFSLYFWYQRIGTFLPLEGTQPFIGQKGKLEKVEEIKIETIVPESRLNHVIKAMLEVHPYEEVAYDLYPLVNEREKAGIGRIGYLSKVLSLKEFIALVKEKLFLSMVRYCGDLEKKIEKVALCGGSGAGYISRAAFLGADVYLTADLKYHEAQEALARDLALVDAGHFGTEWPVVETVAAYLRQELLKKDVKVVVSQINSNPFGFM